MNYDEANGEFCQKRSRSCGSAVPSHSHSRLTGRLSGTKHDKGNITILTRKLLAYYVHKTRPSKSRQTATKKPATPVTSARDPGVQGKIFVPTVPPSHVRAPPDDHRTRIEISLSAPQPTLLLSRASSPTFPASSSAYRVDNYNFHPTVPPSRPHHGEYTRHLARRKLWSSSILRQNDSRASESLGFSVASDCVQSQKSPNAG